MKATLVPVYNNTGLALQELAFMWNCVLHDFGTSHTSCDLTGLAFLARKSSAH
jgi:hypothetical protein